MAQDSQLKQQVSLGSAAANDVFEGGVAANPADDEAIAAVGQHLERLDVVDRLAAHHGVSAARVVADHPAEGVVSVRGRIGHPGQVVRRWRSWSQMTPG
jgi:hypothetical protein